MRTEPIDVVKCELERVRQELSKLRTQEQTLTEILAKVGDHAD